jgi:ATP-dependent DNA helicase RecQ
MAFKMKDPVNVLNEVFGYPDFREGQREIVDAVLAGDDVLALMKTSGGKSLCFQVPALCMNGTTIVISPLISLMKDQVDALLRKDVRAGMVNSDMPMDEVANTMFNLSNGFYKIFYVSPERLANEEFLQILANIEIPFFAVDEAHCVSMWGHAFRTDYTMISQRLDVLEEMKGVRIPRAAYTATATPIIKDDIKKQLGMRPDAAEFLNSFNRDNLQLHVIQSNDKETSLLEILNAKKEEPSIIYCSTAKAVEQLYHKLKGLGFKAGMYHGKLEAEMKNEMQEQFLSDDLDIMVATNAFGMGVDKPNVRNVIHYQMPANLEGYFQEVGRGGRDGKPSSGFLLYSKRDRKIHEFFIKLNYPIRSEIESIRNVLATFGQPSAYTADWLVGLSNSVTVDANQVDGIMRVLKTQGLIELLEEPDGGKSFSLLDIYKDISMERIDERRQIANENLMSMEHFCGTNLCRKRNVLRYFGEKSKSHNCGSCDVCLGLTQKKELMASVIRPEVVTGVITLVHDMDVACIKATLREVLIGTNNIITERYQDNKSFGLLAGKSMPEVDSVINALDKDGILVIRKDRIHSIVLSGRGQSLYENRDRLEVSSRGSLIPPKKQVDGYDAKVKRELEVFRDRWAMEMRTPKFMVMGDKLIEKMAIEKPKSLDDLSRMGLSSDKVSKFGKSLLEVIDKATVKQTLEFSF